MSNYNRKRLANPYYLHKKRNKRITKKLQKIYRGECSAEHLKKLKMRAFRKRNKLDCKAVEIAKKIHFYPYFWSEDKSDVIKADTCSLWEKYMAVNKFDECDFREMKCLLSAIRKAITDRFSIENTYLHEIPFSDNQMIVADFVNKDDCDKKSVDIRGISFYCYYDKLFAQPVKTVEEDGITNSYEVKTCQEAETVD